MALQHGRPPTGHASDAIATTYTYTAAGQPATIADNAGNTWDFTYDLHQRVVSSSDPQSAPGTHTTTTYLPGGEIRSATNPDGKQLSYTYDALGRQTAEYNTTGNVAQSAANQLIGWTYDTLAKGQPTSAIRYTNGAGDAAHTYTQAVQGYNAAYSPTGVTVTIPSAEGSLAGTYQSTRQYDSATGTQIGQHYFAECGLPKEQVNLTYTPGGLLNGFGGSYVYANSILYSPLGQVLQSNFGLYGKQLARTETYDQPTSRLISVSDSLQTLSNTLDTTALNYNQAGNLTSQDTSQYGVQVHDTQCFNYDNQQRLSAAWTDTNGITTTTNSRTAQVFGIGKCNDSAPVAGKVTGGPAPYWESYGYDALGDRVTSTNHDTSVSSTAGNVTQTLSYNGYNPSTGANTAASTPNAVQQVATSTSSGTITSGYTYDNAGETKTRLGQSFTYDAEGNTASVSNTTTGTTATYTYSADKTLLLQHDPATNTTILYLPFGEEIHLTGATSISSLRYYTQSPDGVTLVRSSAGVLTYELSDTRSTATTTVNASTLAATRRYEDPYGNARGTKPASWPDQHSYLGKPTDQTTGLDLLGARNYDPVTGRFLTSDPLLETKDPQQLNGYSYAGDDPVNSSDPSGLMGRAILDPEGCSGAYTVGCHGREPSENFDRPGINLGEILGNVVSTVYHASGASDVVDCASNPSLSGCGQAALAVATTVGTGGGGAVARGVAKTVGKDIVEAGAKDAVEAGAKDATKDAVKSTVEDAASCVGPTPGPHSFTAETSVLMADGASKPISQVKVGDTVSNADPASGSEQKHRVDAVIVTKTDHDFADVAVATPSGDRTIHTTFHHPFYSADKASFVEASDLKPGDKLKTPDGTVTVSAVHLFHTTQTTYDLTIDGIHTYYVVAGDTPVLVHNTSGCGEIVTDTFSSFEQARNKALDLLGPVDPATRTPVVGRLEKATTTYGRVVGFETRVDGVWKQFRLDYDPVKGPHINIQIGKGADAVKYAVPWSGTEDDFAAILNGNS